MRRLSAILIGVLSVTMVLTPGAAALHDNTHGCVDPFIICETWDAARNAPHDLPSVDTCDDGQVGLVVGGDEVCVTPPDPTVDAGIEQCDTGGYRIYVEVNGNGPETVCFRIAEPS